MFLYQLQCMENYGKQTNFSTDEKVEVFRNTKEFWCAMDEKSSSE